MPLTAEISTTRCTVDTWPLVATRSDRDSMVGVGRRRRAESIALSPLPGRREGEALGLGVRVAVPTDMLVAAQR